MKAVLHLITVISLAVPASAQALNETFDTGTTGVFPPATWQISYLPAHAGVGNVDEWSEVLVVGMNSGTGLTFPPADAAAHQYFNGVGVCDDRLETPDMDLSSYSAPELTYDGCLGWAAFMAHTGGAVVGASYIDVSTDGGTTWSTIWQEASNVDYYTTGIMEDMTATAANQSQVRVAFHYEGDYAHEWGVDNVIVDSVGPTGPGLSVICGAGQVDIQVIGCTPGGMVAIARGLAAPYVHQGPICNGLILGVGVSHRRMVTASAGGTAVWNQLLNPIWCGSGIHIQAVDVSTCTTTGLVPL